MNIAGWVKFHKKILKWEWYEDLPVRILFLHLLLIAEFKERKYKGSIIPSGSLVTTYSKLSNETKLTKQQLQTALSKLKSTGEINIQSIYNQTLIKLVNYRLYQGSENAEQYTNNKSSINEQYTNNTPSINPTLEKPEITADSEPLRSKEIKNKRNKDKKSVPPTPAPDHNGQSNPGGKPVNLRNSAKQAYGEYGWVKLDDVQYNRLIDEYGHDAVIHYIAIVDEKAQMTGNKNKWKDWNLTVRNAIRGKWQSSGSMPKAAQTRTQAGIEQYLADIQANERREHVMQLAQGEEDIF